MISIQEQDGWVQSVVEQVKSAQEDARAFGQAQRDGVVFSEEFVTEMRRNYYEITQAAHHQLNKARVGQEALRQDIRNIITLSGKFGKEVHSALANLRQQSEARDMAVSMLHTRQTENENYTLRFEQEAYKAHMHQRQELKSWADEKDKRERDMTETVKKLQQRLAESEHKRLEEASQAARSLRSTQYDVNTANQSLVAIQEEARVTEQTLRRELQELEASVTEKVSEQVKASLSKDIEKALAREARFADEQRAEERKRLDLQLEESMKKSAQTVIFRPEEFEAETAPQKKGKGKGKERPEKTPPPAPEAEGSGSGGLPPATGGDPPEPSDPDDSSSSDDEMDKRERKLRRALRKLTGKKKEKKSAVDKLAELIYEDRMNNRGNNKRPSMKLPELYDGKDYTIFRSWWRRVDQYMQVNEPTMPTDDVKIFWVGSLLKGAANKWHEFREARHKALKMKDTWESFAEDFQERFSDDLANDRDAEQMEELKYEESIQAYFAQLGELNTRLNESGTRFRLMIRRAMPQAIIDAVMHSCRKLPQEDDALITALTEAGETYEEGLCMKKLHGKKASATTSSTTVKGTTTATPDKKAADKGSSSASKPKADKGKTVSAFVRKEKLWEGDTWRNGIPKEEWGPRGSENCRRCLRSGHEACNCYAKTNTKGTKLPAHPSKVSNPVSATKRKRDEDEQEPGEEIEVKAEPKKAKIAAVIDQDVAMEDLRFWEPSSDAESLD